MKPVICNYYLTYRCNARCGFCTIWKNPAVPRSDEADPDTIIKNLDALRSNGVHVVDFTGGEPLLYEGLPSILRHAKSIGLLTTVTSNGIRFPEKAGELSGLVDYLQFSLHGATAEIHDSITGSPSFSSVMESVEKARSLGDRPSFIHTVTDSNIDDVPSVTAFARSLKIPLYLNPCFAYPGTGGLSEANARILGKLARGRGVIADRGYLAFAADGGNHASKPRCLAVSSTVVISPDNKLLLPCYHYNLTAIPIDGNLSGILHSTEREKERTMEGRHPFCEGCTVYCYMRASLFRRFDRYFLPSILSAVKYLVEVRLR